VTHALATDVGDRKRLRDDINEDCVAVTPVEFEARGERETAEIAVLADGAGGHTAGDTASRLAVSTVSGRLVSALFSPDRDDTKGKDGDRRSANEVERTIETVLADVDKRIQQFAHRRNITAHTTVVAGVRLRDRFHYAWVGDSRAYVVNETHDRITQLTTDHTRGDETAPPGTAAAFEARIDPNEPPLDQALGGSQYEDPQESTISVETATIGLYGDDTVLLTSDGLLDAHAHKNDRLYERYTVDDAEGTRDARHAVEDELLTHAEIKDAIVRTESLSAAATELVDLANGYGGKDNVSVVLLREDSLERPSLDLDRRGPFTGEDVESAVTRVVSSGPPADPGSASDDSRGAGEERGDGRSERGRSDHGPGTDIREGQRPTETSASDDSGTDDPSGESPGFVEKLRRIFLFS
jgi:serine/threonine protein phosphatase PrpC